MRYANERGRAKGWGAVDGTGRLDVGDFSYSRFKWGGGAASPGGGGGTLRII